MISMPLYYRPVYIQGLYRPINLRATPCRPEFHRLHPHLAIYIHHIQHWFPNHPHHWLLRQIPRVWLKQSAADLTPPMSAALDLARLLLCTAKATYMYAHQTKCLHHHHHHPEHQPFILLQQMPALRLLGSTHAPRPIPRLPRRLNPLIHHRHWLHP